MPTIHTNSRFLGLCGTAALVLVLAACTGGDGGDAAGDDATTATTAGGDALSAVVLHADVLQAKPAGAISVTEAKQVAAGEAVVVQGRIGGQKDPFAEGRAGLQLVDPAAAVACDAMPDDHCPAPWDFCCDLDAASAASSFVQVLGDDGRPVAESLKGVGGMQPGSFLVVEGTVDEQSTPDNLVINATGFFVDTEREVVMVDAVAAPEQKHDHDHGDHDHAH